jgi:hypothetical protein
MVSKFAFSNSTCAATTWAADRRAPVVVSTAIAGLLAEVLKKEVPEVGLCTS